MIIPITIKHEYLEMIMTGSKSLEIRVGYPNILSIMIGDHILFMSGTNRQIAIVNGIRKYSTFIEMLSNEDFRKILPGSSEVETLKKLQAIYPAAKESLGVIVIEIKPIKSTETIP